MTARSENHRAETKETLLAWIGRDRERLISFLSQLVRAASPNPPGDTRAAATEVQALLNAEGLDHRVISPHPEMPNLVASFEGHEPGRHLVLNGHIDVFRRAIRQTGPMGRGAVRSPRVPSGAGARWI